MSEPKRDPNPTTELLDFLTTLSRLHEPGTRGQVGCVTSRAAERARIDAKRLGYARQRQRTDGKWGRQITDAGNAILAEVRAARIPPPPRSPA